MLTILFIILLIGVLWKLIVWSMRAAWGITKIVFTIVLMPVVLIVMALAGLIYLAVPILIIVGIVALLGSAKSR